MGKIKEDISNIMWLAIIGIVLYVISTPSTFKIIAFVIKFGLRIGAFVFIFFTAVSIFNLISDIIFKKKEDENMNLDI